MCEASYIRNTALKAQGASLSLAQASWHTRREALLRISAALDEHREELFKANEADIACARENGRNEAFIDRLRVSEKVLTSMKNGLAEVASSKDPLGEVIYGATLKSGVKMIKKRVPLGVVAIIYEARPNVTVDAAALCIMSGNAAVLKGSREALNSNLVLGKVISQGLSQAGLDPHSVAVIEKTDRASTTELMRLNGIIDVLIPRGGKELIKSTVENATVPVIETGAGNCHIYVDASADIKMGTNIIVNAKLSRPSVCNAAETLLVHKDIAERFLPVAAEALINGGCTLKGDERARAICPEMAPACNEDWETEYLDTILAVRVVDNIDEAIEHINKYSTKHSEAIVTRDFDSAKKFEALINSAAVYVNASTRFTDGGEFGMGAEIGISTQKLHARGPMGLTELTTVKYILEGNGEVR
ncbi:MAG: glutamate-5-semialdehyde dehydrogenase [Clostridiales bacterium]|nr:glutamate-5-semialdehyde dehydrogenase [Clostridiales bacterium]